MTKEVFKPIPGYEGHYEVSNLGNVISIKFNKKRILKPIHEYGKYLSVHLYKNGKARYSHVHQLVAISFLGHKPCGHKLVVDHINDIKTDNRVENLRIVTQRENAFKTQGKHSSKYKGVYWHIGHNKWHSQITINNKKHNVGYFKDEYEAHLAYQNALQKHLNNEQSIQTSKKATENIC